MEFIDLPPMRKAAGTVRLPGSKSISNRVLLLAALAEGETLVEDLLDSDDTRVMRNAISALGVSVMEEGAALRVVGCKGRFPQLRADLFVGNSGLSIRTLVPAIVASLSGCGDAQAEVRLSGVPRMHERPIGDLVDALRPREFAIAGEIVTVAKLSKAETSDTLSSKDKPALVEPWVLPEPLLPVAIHAKSKADEDKLASALQRLVAEDVTMRMEHNAETHQVVLWAMGQAHIEELLGRLHERYGVQVEAEPFRTALRETFIKKVTVKGRHVKQSGGHGQYAVCDLEIEPLPRGGGFEFVDKVVGGAVPRNFIPSVEKGARAQLEKGVLAGYPLVDVRVTLFDGKAHSVDSSDMAFQTAAQLALKEAANESTVALLEPIDSVDITVSDDYVGAVMSDLRGRRGQVLGTEPAPTEGWTIVHAEVPQTELSRYPIDLRSVSHGTGSFSRAMLRYDYMPADKAKEFAKAAKD